MAAINFAFKTLSPLKVSYVVAIDDSSAWAAASYLGAYEWNDNAGYKNFFKPSGIENLKWLQFNNPGPKAGIYTIISKRNGDLFHWQILKGKRVRYEASVLFLDVEDGTAVKLYKNTEHMQIVHDMTYEAAIAIKPTSSKKTVIFNHCAEGIGRSAILTLAEAMLASSYLDPEKFKTPLSSTLDENKLLQSDKHLLPSVDEREKDNYPQRLVKWGHQFRHGMLGGRSGGQKPCMEQIEDCWETGKRLVSLPDQANQYQSVKERVRVTKEEQAHILSLPTKAKQFFLELIKKAEPKKIASRTFFSSYGSNASEFEAFKIILEEKSSSPDVEVYINIDQQKAMFQEIIKRGSELGNDKAMLEYLKTASWEGVEQLHNQIQDKLSSDIQQLSSLQEVLALRLVERWASCSIL
ncbi:MAG: hypothetical protein ABI597_03075 [Gammaproteobacteria bacterium]